MQALVVHYVIEGMKMKMFPVTGLVILMKQLHVRVAGNVIK